MVQKKNYSRRALSSDTVPRLDPFLGLQASSSTSKIRVALHRIYAINLDITPNIGKIFLNQLTAEQRLLLTLVKLLTAQLYKYFCYLCLGKLSPKP